MQAKHWHELPDQALIRVLNWFREDKSPAFSQYIILATAGLRNKYVRKRLPLPDDYGMQDDDNEDNVGGQIDTEKGRGIRPEVIETIFGEV